MVDLVEKTNLANHRPCPGSKKAKMACSECNRMCTTNGLHAGPHRCDACWVAGLQSGAIKTGRRRFKRMCLNEVDDLIYICDYCSGEMEQDRPLHQWCRICEEWWTANVEDDSGPPAETHLAARVVEAPWRCRQRKQSKERVSFFGPAELIKTISVERNEEELTIKVPRDQDRELSITVST